MLLATILPGLGLGLLKGMFLAELLKKPNKGKGYGHHDSYGYDHHKRQSLASPAYQDIQYPQYPASQEYQPYQYAY